MRLVRISELVPSSVLYSPTLVALEQLLVLQGICPSCTMFWLNNQLMPSGVHIHTSGCKLEWQFPENWADFDETDSLYACSVEWLGCGRMTNYASTKFQKIRQISSNGLFSYFGFVLGVRLHINFWQTFGKKCFYNSIPSYVYVFVCLCNWNGRFCMFNMCKILAAFRSGFSA